MVGADLAQCMGVDAEKTAEKSCSRAIHKLGFELLIHGAVKKDLKY